MNEKDTMKAKLSRDSLKQFLTFTDGAKGYVLNKDEWTEIPTRGTQVEHYLLGRNDIELENEDIVDVRKKIIQEREDRFKHVNVDQTNQPKKEKVEDKKPEEKKETKKEKKMFEEEFKKSENTFDEGHVGETLTEETDEQNN